MLLDNECCTNGCALVQSHPSALQYILHRSVGPWQLAHNVASRATLVSPCTHVRSHAACVCGFERVRFQTVRAPRAAVLPDTVAQLLVATSPTCRRMRMCVLTCCNICVTPGAGVYSIRHLSRWSL